jgi:hypothetical protein
MESKVVEERDVRELAKILSEDPILCRNTLKFYTLLDLPAAEFLPLEKIEISFDFFYLTLQKWRSKLGKQATFLLLKSKLTEESFKRVADKISELAQQQSA